MAGVPKLISTSPEEVVVCCYKADSISTKIRTEGMALVYF